MSIKKLFCNDWEFVKTPLGTEYCENLPWRPVDIPHDWLIYNTKALYETSTGWYRRKLFYTKKEENVSLRFEGVYMDSKVYVNNVLAGEWKYGYSTFELEISSLLQEGENLIAVRVDYHAPNTRWYSGAGIFRPVYLKFSPKIRILPGGVYISTEIDGYINITTEVERPEGVMLKGISLRHTVLLDENIISQREQPCRACDKSCMDEYVLREGYSYSLNDDCLTVHTPLLWSMENPILYTMKTELIQEEQVIDCEIARDTKRSFGDTANIRLTPDKTELIANSDDLIFVDISAYDKAGEFVANANDRVFVQVSGAGRLIGLDNGDSTDFEQYKGTSRRLFSGKLLAVIAAKTTPGEIMLRVTSSTNLESTIQLKAVPGEDINGITAIEENIQREFDCSRGENDIPVRKIELVGEKKVFTLEQKELKFTTKIYPANSTYKEEIEYRITTALGIPSNLAEITSLESGEITVKCKGDGEFCLRALCKNETDKYHILSAIKLSATGLGTCFVDPYHLVKGGLYFLEGGNIANGLERGIKFEGGRSWFGFENVDFGPVGSDTVTLPICTWNGVGIQVYDGIPDEGELIGDFRYDREPVIMNYVPQTFQLQKKLKGVHTLCFLATDSFDMEGFVFEKQKKEVSLLYAAE